MNKCKKCKYWKEPEDKQWRAKELCHPLDEDTFEEKSISFSVRICESNKITWFERPATEDSIALLDGSDYFAQMLTAEKFGCVNFEKK